MKSTLPFNHWEENVAPNPNNDLDEVAEQRHQKLQELKQVEFEQEMGYRLSSLFTQGSFDSR